MEMNRRFFLQLLPAPFMVEQPKVPIAEKSFVENFLAKVDRAGRTIGRSRWSYSVRGDRVRTFFDAGRQKNCCQAIAVLYYIENFDFTEETENKWGFKTVEEAKKEFKYPFYVDENHIWHVDKNYEDDYEVRIVSHEYFDYIDLKDFATNVRLLLNWCYR